MPRIWYVWPSCFPLHPVDGRGGAGKQIGASTGHVTAKVDVCERCAPFESRVANVSIFRVAAGYGYVREGDTEVESVVVNVSDAGRDSDSSDVGASEKGVLADVSDAIRDGDIGEEEAAGEGLASDSRDGNATEFVGDGQFARVGGVELGDGSLAVTDGVSVEVLGGSEQKEKDGENAKTRENETTAPRAGRVRTTRCVVSHGLTFRLES